MEDGRHQNSEDLILWVNSDGDFTAMNLHSSAPLAVNQAPPGRRSKVNVKKSVWPQMSDCFSWLFFLYST